MTTIRALLAILLAAAAVGLAASCGQGSESRKFTKEEWQASLPGSDVRYAMAKDLVSSRILVGRSREEVEALLGDGSFKLSTMRLYYNLGGPIGLTSFGNTLIVQLDDRSMVTKTFIYKE